MTGLLKCRICHKDMYVAHFVDGRLQRVCETCVEKYEAAVKSQINQELDEIQRGATK